MAGRQLLTEEERRVVFGVPMDRDALARHYTLTRTADGRVRRVRTPATDHERPCPRSRQCPRAPRSDQ